MSTCARSTVEFEETNSRKSTPVHTGYSAEKRERDVETSSILI